NPRAIYVKLKDNYMKIWFNRDVKVIILAIESRIETNYQYNMQLKDNRSDSIFLNDTYFSEDHIKKIYKGYYLIEYNLYKYFITSNFYELNHLKINKIIREVLKTDDEQTELESKERQFKENYIEQTKRGLMKKLLG